MLAYNAEPPMKSKMYQCSYCTCTGGSGFTSMLHLSKPACTPESNSSMCTLVRRSRTPGDFLNLITVGRSSLDL